MGSIIRFKKIPHTYAFIYLYQSLNTSGGYLWVFSVFYFQICIYIKRKKNVGFRVFNLYQKK